MDPAQAFMKEVEKLQEPMNAVMRKGDSPIQRWYSGSVAFITGGNGFLGKLLIEKLLRACNMKKIYILLRGKKNKSMMERLKFMIDDPIFDLLRKTNNKELSKIVPVEGDIEHQRLGLKDADWNTLVKEVDIIFHLAATTKFDSPLRVATNINVRGTKEVLALGKACKKLRLVNYISTAYTHATVDKINGDVLEKFYDAPIAPAALLELVETVSESKLVAITEKLIEGWPNTYSFTKAVAEKLVKEMEGDLPICVMRPSIVMASYYEPAPGWMDSSVLYGATGIFFGSVLGVLHVFYRNNEARVSMVPGDYVTNATIAAGCHAARRWTEGQRDINIYAISTNRCNYNLRSIFTCMDDIKTRCLATPKALWYCFVIGTNNKINYFILSWLLHFFPAYLFVATYRKIYNMNLSFAYFVRNEWIFKDDNTEEVFNALAIDDKAIFNFDMSTMDVDQYFRTLCMGIRQYVIKDGLKDTVNAYKKQRLLKIINYIFFVFYFSIISYIAFCILLWVLGIFI